MKVCKICGKEFAPIHFNQKLCSDDCKKAARSASLKRYKESEKGLEATRRWHKSDKFKENEKRYREKYMQNIEYRKKLVLRNKKYLQNHPDALERKRERDKNFARTERGHELNKKARDKYRKTEKGNISQRIHKYNSRADGTIDKQFVIDLLNGDTCYYCGHKIVGKKTIDHKIPTSRNGTNASDNIVLACIHCNAQKGNKTEKEYREWLANANNLRVRSYGRI